VERTELGSTVRTAGDTASARTTDAPLVRGTALGRYLLLDPIGAGGMGVVYGAYDPKLDRKVAIKLLHPSGERSDSKSQGQHRLLREAQSLARLQHPEVLTVLDVGVHEGRVFVAMEFVDGRTLGTWLRERPRPWREVLDAFIAAGRGLQAAHAKGLVHRDFSSPRT
jgi:serine/threonine protein kinase